MTSSFVIFGSFLSSAGSYGRSVVTRAAFDCQRLSGLHPQNKPKVIIIDQIGVLASIYSLADAVFMGGSLARRGGQNPIEAASWKKPILHGPNISNFQDAYAALDESGECRGRCPTGDRADIGKAHGETSQ